MTDVYVIRNQHGHFWGKRKQWLSGDEPKTVLRTRHEDEAVNILFELSAKDTELRGEVVTAQLSERGEPIIEPSQIPLPSLEEPATGTEPAPDAPVEEAGSTAQETH
ncbi:hypothetical protein E2F43_01870 [Seongchinamella unica]|uniref:Uncharacterized protein n=1 Tax=Seongchinamella unica TaxID=2547392 RepID=A0A4R5LUE2_9GAMM|nr:hypothetical protein [Seongchinamella unica]TDG15013.1 hypothetical protein E2F43_01870 [Seongchinamella unica]